jgi:hypothetical protein
MSRADPPFEPAPRGDRARILAARQALIRFRHHDPAGSIADIHDALADDPE